MTKNFALLVAMPAMVLSLVTSAAVAAEWRNHAAPFNFLFGNEIDSHQQTRQARDGSLF